MTTKIKNITAWILAGLLAFAFFGSGISKLIGVEMQIKNLESWGYPLWLRFPIGLGEIALGIALIIPKFRRMAIYGVFVFTVVAVITHLQAGQSAMIFPSILFSVIAIAMYFLIRQKKLNQTV
jgi:uncharacterized membrane protein YphA (DoxX/SURF4 family)